MLSLHQLIVYLFIRFAICRRLVMDRGAASSTGNKIDLRKHEIEKFFYCYFCYFFFLTV